MGGKGGKGGKHGKKRKHNADKGAKGKGGGDGDKGGKGKGSKGAPPRRGLLGALPERAFIISSDSPQQSPKATREAVRLLMTAAEALDSTIAEATDRATAELEPSTQSKSSVSNQLEAELQELREDCEPAAKRPRIIFQGEVMRGLAVLACPKKADFPNFPRPSVLVDAVFAAQKQESTVRFIVRLLPLDVVCSPHLSNFRTAAAAALPAAFAGKKDGSTWYMAFFNRAMSTIKRDDALIVLKEVLAPIGMEMSVSDAEYTVLVEVNPSLCGFSVLRNYEEGLHECHLQRASNACARDDEDEESDENASGDDFTEPIAVDTVCTEPVAAPAVAAAADGHAASSSKDCDISTEKIDENASSADFTEPVAVAAAAAGPAASADCHGASLSNVCDISTQTIVADLAPDGLGA